MKIFEDGNFREGLRVFLVVAGIALVLGSVNIGLNSTSTKFMFIVGIVIAAVGGYASQAHMLKIKPFDNSSKKARKSYEAEDDKQDGPK